jgi:hypothetical protein
VISKNILLSLQAKFNLSTRLNETLNYQYMCRKIVLFAAILVIIPSFVLSQNSTNSPYTRYGYGLLADKSFAPQRAMGGIGYGLRNSQFINPMNPASYSALDSLTFMFDMGVSGQMGWLTDDVNKDQRLNGNIDYIALQFPLMAKMGFGIGLEQISSVGYKYGDAELLPNGGYKLNVNQGTGGLSQIYGALSYDLFERLSVGLKFGYLFGSVNHETSVQLDVSSSIPSVTRDTIFSNGLTYELGLQYHHPIGKYETLVIGAVYTPKIRLNGKVTKITLPSTENTYNVSRDSVFELPESYGLGLSYNKLNKLTLGADVQYQRWASAKFYDTKDAFNDRLKINAGGEIIPNIMSGNYFNRIRYRAGLSYSKSYLVAEGASGTANEGLSSGYKEYGASVGIGFPMPMIEKRRSFLNLALGYNLVQPDINTFPKEQYFKLTVSYTFNELWFFKRKVQ